MKRILITGSRDWRSAETIQRAIWDWVSTECAEPEELIVVHGDASRGADRMAREYARSQSWLTEEAHPAAWDLHGRAAGFIRNQAMVDLGADVCLAFIHNSSKGASHTAKQAERAGIHVLRYLDNDEDAT